MLKKSNSSKNIEYLKSRDETIVTYKICSLALQTAFGSPPAGYTREHREGAGVDCSGSRT